MSCDLQKMDLGHWEFVILAAALPHPLQNRRRSNDLHLCEETLVGLGAEVKRGEWHLTWFVCTLESEGWVGERVRESERMACKKYEQS